ncbi:M3 family metallopeptidase [Zhihengliuella halotolerans]|uniref:Peptidyl-dipeptidase Dcp n=1 Tax=Zhihengliuella halotolerans TaxID=370736 RepID=A0A4V2G9T4_9MICC|nr:M3 family metallopeptidase [Zhihengliuella halotolerans]RZU61496.1 peptidyl-dipeptidase Dcp [Zhihengliuella halotolerans]
MSNPLLQPSVLPFGIPDYAVLTAADYVNAVQVGIDEQNAELQRLLEVEDPATFENTIQAFALTGETLRRALQAFNSVKPAHGTDDILEAAGRIDQLVSAHSDEVRLDQELYARLSQAGGDRLVGEDARLREEVLRVFRHAGVEVPAEDLPRLREINAELARLGTEYSRRLLAGQNAAAVHFDDIMDLSGLSEPEVAAAAQAADTAGLEGGYLIPLVLPTGQPALERLTQAASRKRIFEASVTRGQSAEHGTLEVARQMALLRAERAGLLGFSSHAEYVIEAQTAPSLVDVNERVSALAERAVANAREEHTTLEKYASLPVNPWDWAYYSNLVKRDRFDLDTTALRPWFELDAVLERGVFEAAGRLYGISLHERFDLPVYHPDIRVWEVRDADGAALGLYLGDFFARPTKTGGAWMTSIRDGVRAHGELPIVTNTLNLPSPGTGPSLLSLDEVRTLFHEFGHALHGLFSDATYAQLAGTNVPRDFVEYPSQVNEMWALHPEIIENYARHVETGEPLPAETLARIHATAHWGEGFSTTEYLAAVVLDLAWHSLAPGDEVEDALEFEDRALRDAGLDPEFVPARYRTGYFKHIFDGGYSAGYYSYIWSEILDADTVEWFAENGGLRRENGRHFRDELLSRGNTRDPLDSFRAFRGRDPLIGPLLARRGLGE